MIRSQRSAVEAPKSQALEKSNKVIGAFVVVGVVANTGDGLGGWRTGVIGFTVMEAGEVAGAGAGEAGAGESRLDADEFSPPLVGNTVLSPEARNIPPPTRLVFTLSRACLASLKVRGGSDFVCAVG